VNRRPVLLLLAIAACHHAPVHKPGDEYLEAIRFEGNRELSNKSLLNGLALHRAEDKGDAADPYQVQLDTDRIKGQYLREGFFDIDVSARVERKGDAATVIFTMREGKRATTRIEIHGLPPEVTEHEVLEKLPLRRGEPFHYDTYDDAKQPLLQVVQDAGYAHAKLDATVDAEIATHTAIIVLNFTPGVRCTFGTVTVQGVGGDLEQAIIDRLHFQKGDLYSPRMMRRTQRDIYAMNRFSTVQITQSPGDSPVVDIKIAVSLAARHQLTYGAGFGADPIDYEVRGRAGYSIVSWPRPLYDVDLDVRPAYAYLRDGGGFEPRVRAIAKLNRMDLFLTRAIGTVEVDFNYLTYEAFTMYGPELQLNYQIQLGTPRVLLSGGWIIQREDFRDISPLVLGPISNEIGLESTELAAAYKESFVVDLRDHPVEPRYGVYAAMQAYQGGKFAGGDYQYEEIIPELRAYAPLGPVVLAARARYGAIYGDIPPSERFYAGGANSNRGFSERELSPQVTGPVMGSVETVPYGGGGMIDSSLEARIKALHVVGMPLEEVVFLDGGDVELTPGDLAFDKLYYAVGAGLRLLTVVGPVRVDLGYRINRTTSEDAEPGSRFAFHLSLGEAF
jgi:outer membrane protein assembly factor BamA